MIRFCPDLTGKEEVKAMFRGHGDFIRPILHACIKERCVAYKNGTCMKYDNATELLEEMKKCDTKKPTRGNSTTNLGQNK